MSRYRATAFKMHGLGNEGMATLPGLNQIQFEGPLLLELIRSASKNPRVLNWLSFIGVFMAIVIIQKFFDFFFRRSNS